MKTTLGNEIRVRRRHRRVSLLSFPLTGEQAEKPGFTGRSVNRQVSTVERDVLSSDLRGLRPAVGGEDLFVSRRRGQNVAGCPRPTFRPVSERGTVYLTRRPS